MPLTRINPATWRARWSAGTVDGARLIQTRASPARTEGGGHDLACRREHDGRVERGRHRVAGTAHPRRAQPAGEGAVAVSPRGDEHLRPAVAGELEHDVGGGAEAVQPEPPCGRELA